VDNIPKSPRREFGPLRIELPFGSIDQAQRALECLQGTTEVAINLVTNDTLAKLIVGERNLVPTK
jgi:hypothetical protein